jgi:hypothetical protein
MITIGNVVQYRLQELEYEARANESDDHWLKRVTQAIRLKAFDGERITSQRQEIICGCECCHWSISIYAAFAGGLHHA